MKAKRLALSDFKARYRKGEDLSQVALAKQFVAKIEKVGEQAERTVKFVLSGIDRDRHGDTVNPRGWRLDNFRTNPVVLWAHNDSKPPVAKAPEIWIAEQADGSALLKATAEFTPRSMYAFGDTIYQMVVGGFVNAVSVGFRPDEWEEATDVDGFFMPVNFLSQELLEFSIVPVPAYPGALAEGTRKGAFDAAEARQWAESALEGDTAQHVFVERRLIELFHKDLSPNPVTVAAGAPSSSDSLEGVPATAPTLEDTAAAVQLAVAKRIDAVTQATVSLRATLETMTLTADGVKAVSAEMAEQLSGLHEELGKLFPVVVEVDPPAADPPAADPPAADPPAAAAAVTQDELDGILTRCEERIHETLVLPTTGRLD